MVQLPSAGELPTQSFGVLPVTGEGVIVITPPRRRMPPAPRLALLAVTGLLVSVVAVESTAAIPPPCVELVLPEMEVLVVVSVPPTPL